MEQEAKLKGNVLKVIQLGLQNRVYEEMKKPRFSVEALTRRLNSEGINITAQSIRKFIRKTKQAQQALIQRDLRTASEIKKLTMDYGNALKAILKEVEEVKNTAKDEKDFATYNQLVGRLMQGIELIAKLTGDMKPKGSVDINFIYNEITTDMDTQMKDARREMFKAAVIDVDSEILEADSEMTDKLNIGDTE